MTRGLAYVGLLAGLVIAGWGVSGIFRGRIVAKSYASRDGERVYWTTRCRADEPGMFWLTVCGYCAVALALGVTAAWLLVRDAMPGR